MLVVQAAAVAIDQATSCIADQFAERSDAILERHFDTEVSLRRPVSTIGTHTHETGA